MKEINKGIGDIGRANSSIFTTLDLTSGFWQMKLEPAKTGATATRSTRLGQRWTRHGPTTAASRRDGFMNDQEDDNLEEADLAFITSILESFCSPPEETKKLKQLSSQAYPARAARQG